jgi:alkanesulfonate monooxygenase SsuD/methylene tetrahydromethanopterin reductase-like flavin-dependent oxidoreductase (luciferase family)
VISPALPLSVLDLAPITSGSDAGQALRNSIDLAQRAEAAGYRRYWLAEHHFTPGVASSAPALLIGQIAAATSSIRVGSGAVQTGHQTPIAIVEEFGILDALFPGRIDLGLGRSGQLRAELVAALARRARTDGDGTSPRRVRQARVVDGLLIPKPFSYAALAGSTRLQYLNAQLQQPGAETPDYRDQVEEILALLDGTAVSPDGDAVVAVPGRGAAVEPWIFGSSRGASAEVAGRHGLAFAASYHITPATALEAVEAYRAAFEPSARWSEPHVAVSADVVVADDEDTARELASPYGFWVRSIRTGQGAIPYPSPAEAAWHHWSAEDRELVADRVDTQFVGTASSVADQLETLARVTGADELVVTTITHRHADRVRSHELLAREWRDRAPGIRAHP